MYYIISAFDKDCKNEDGILQKIQARTPLLSQDMRQDKSEILALKVSPPVH